MGGALATLRRGSDLLILGLRGIRDFDLRGVSIKMIGKEAFDVLGVYGGLLVP